MTKAHSTQNGIRNMKATLAELYIVDFCGLEGLLNGLGQRGRLTSHGYYYWLIQFSTSLLKFRIVAGTIN
jgi:hypothetical protein